MTIYIGNFDLQWNNEKLQELFSPYGQVSAATIMMDGFTGLSRGFGYVTMPNEAEAAAAVQSLHQTEVGNEKLTVKTAEPQSEKSGSYKVGNGGVNPYRFKKN